MELAKSTWKQVDKYLKTRNMILIPLGSTEQHGPTGIFCTDYIIPEKIAIAAGEKTKTLVTPVISFGMSNHHLAFPGTISLNPSTLMKVTEDIVASLYRNGFRRFLFVNGHGGNISTMNAAFSEIREKMPGAVLRLVSWYQFPKVTRKAYRFFRDREGQHSTPSELSATMHIFPGLLKKARKYDIKKPDKAKVKFLPSAKDFRKLFKDGRMWSDPSLANEERGKALFDLAVEELTREISEMKK
jgi:creatinine amidohydrolase